MEVSDPVGDRRMDVRFEILGDLWGTFVSTQSFPLVDLGYGGARVEYVEPLTVGPQHQVRLALGGDPCDVMATVKHVTPRPDHPALYGTGLAFVNPTRESKEQIATFLRGPSAVPATAGSALMERFVERRRTRRFFVPEWARLERASATSVRLLDVGWRGLLLASPQALQVGQHGHLSARLGDLAIVGDVEVLRISTQADRQAYRAGVRFISLEGATERAMQQFLAAESGRSPQRHRR